jgi:hypothetical protein
LQKDRLRDFGVRSEISEEVSADSHAFARIEFLIPLF